MPSPTPTPTPTRTPTPLRTVAPGQPWSKLVLGEPVEVNLPWIDPLDSRFPVVPDVEPASVAWQGQTLIVASRVDAGARPYPFGKAVVATTSDWIHWTTLATGGFPFDGERILALSSTASSLVLLTGTNADKPVTHAWTSADGKTWQAQDASVFKDGSVQAIASGSTGVVAVGYTGTYRSEDAVVWLTTNGADWRRIRLPGNTGEIDEAHSIAAFVGGFSVVGTVGYVSGYPFPDLPRRQYAGDAAAWYSADGKTWKRASVGGNDKDPGWMQRVFAAEGGLVATGSLYYGEEPPTAAWTSKDGSSWKLAVDYRNAPADYRPSIPVCPIVALPSRLVKLKLAPTSNCRLIA